MSVFCKCGARTFQAHLRRVATDKAAPHAYQGPCGAPPEIREMVVLRGDGGGEDVAQRVGEALASTPQHTYAPAIRLAEEPLTLEKLERDIDAQFPGLLDRLARRNAGERRIWGGWPHARD